MSDTSLIGYLRANRRSKKAGEPTQPDTDKDEDRTVPEITDTSKVLYRERYHVQELFHDTPWLKFIFILAPFGLILWVLWLALVRQVELLAEQKYSDGVVYFLVGLAERIFQTIVGFIGIGPSAVGWPGVVIFSIVVIVIVYQLARGLFRYLTSWRELTEEFLSVHERGNVFPFFVRPVDFSVGTNVIIGTNVTRTIIQMMIFWGSANVSVKYLDLEDPSGETRKQLDMRNVKKYRRFEKQLRAVVIRNQTNDARP